MSEHRDDPQVLDALGRAVPQVAPPAGLRARVLAAAVGEPILPREGGAAAETPAAAAPPPASRTVPFPDRSPAAAPVSVRPAASRWPWLVAAAAVLVAAVTTLGWMSARGEISRLQATIAGLQANAAALLNVRAEFDRERTERDRAVAILNASDVHSAPLAGVQPNSAARGRVYVSASRGVFFAAEGLPPLPAGRTYQLWTIVGGQPVSHGVFGLEADGRAQVLGQAPPGPVEAIAVTIEPAGGVPAPTGDKVLLGVPAN